MEPELTERPVTKHMILTVFNNTGKEHLVKNTFILPLIDFDVLLHTLTGVMSIKFDDPSQLPKGIYGKVWKNAYLRVTSDPKVEWAGDKGDLGTFNMTYKMPEATLEVIDTTLTIRFDASLYVKDLHFPDREKWTK